MRPLDADPPGQRLPIYDENKPKGPFGPMLLFLVPLYVVVQVILLAFFPGQEVPEARLLIVGPVLVLVLAFQWLKDIPRISAKTRWLVVVLGAIAFAVVFVVYAGGA